VLELGSFIAGPFAGQLLGDYGADVIKIEPPGAGDPMRTWGTVVDGEGLWWPTIARNKRSVAIDLHGDEGRQLVRRLAGQCSIVIENFRPGRLDDWGLDYATLAGDNPALVMVHVSGYGQTGPRAQAAGFGSIGEAVGGIRHTTGSPDRPPARAGISLGDAIAAMFSVIGALSAYTHAVRTGQGQEVDVALYESVFALMESSLADFEVTGKIRERSGSVLPGVAPSNVYPTSDGAEVIIAANADSVYARLCKAMGRPEFIDDDRFATHAARGENMTVIDAEIAAWTASLTADRILATLDEFGVPADRIFTAPDMLRDPHYRARAMVLREHNRVGIEIPMAGIVPKFTATPGAVHFPGPRLGEHTEAVLTELLGLEDDDIARLVDAGVCHLDDTAS
jgi:formyl-CoA transferase/succinyl-CoA--D-citramalate CoA-transferase